MPSRIYKKEHTLLCSKGNLHEHFSDRLQDLEAFLISQRYPQRLIKRGIANRIPIIKLRTTHNKSIPFVVTHNPGNQNIFIAARTKLKLDNLIIKTFIQGKRQQENLSSLDP